MGLKVFTIDFEELIAEKGIRNDFKYFDWIKNQKRVFSSKIKLGKTLNYYYKGFAFKSDDFLEDGEGFVLKGININSDYSIDFDNIQHLPDNFFDDKKYVNFKVKKGDIILSLVGSIGKLALIEDDYKMLLNQNNIALRLNKELFNSKFFIYMVDFLLKEIIEKLYSNSGYSFLRIEDLFNIDLPLIPKSKQDQIVAQIEPIEKNIKKLKDKIKKPQEIINKVFAREFRFDENLYNEFGKGMTAGTQIAKNRSLRVFYTDFKELSRSKFLRFSTRFHNTPTKKLMDFLDNIETLKVKDMINTYEKGIQPRYNSDGEIPVVKITNLKNGYIDFTETENITIEQFKKIDDKKKLKENDVIICATGKISLGKIDIFEKGIEAITTVDNYILRINKEKYNPLFFTYFFRSILGFFQIERDYTGATNQIHLYWNQISELKIPNISLSQQQKIVDEIKAELDKQKEIKDKIESERNKIDEIIEKAVK